MYQIKCDDNILYDPREDGLIVLNPKCKLAVNTVGSASFTVLSDHPYYNRMQKLKSVFEIKQNNDVIFKGRMTNDSQDFQNRFSVSLEGALAYTNDTLIPPFNFPGDFPEAEDSENMVEYFLNWILAKHNERVQDWQKLKLGTVTVSDPNNYITRSSTSYATTWNTLKTKLFESALGGYLCIRYEDDGNYIDYVKSFELTNNQRVVFGENLLDITRDSDATDTYTAIMPFGAETEGEGGAKYTLSLDSMEDGDITTDLVKDGLYIYSRSLVNEYGWRCVPVEKSTWKDVTEMINLKNKAVEYLSGTAVKLANTITAKALDLHFTDDEIQSFRVYRNVLVDAPYHHVNNVVYPLTQLDIDILNPQNTLITIGDTVKSLTGVTNQGHMNNQNRIESAEKDIADNRTETSVIKNQLIIESSEIINTCNDIILGVLESYVETSDFSKYQEDIQSQLRLLSDEMLLKFNETTKQILDVDGDLQTKFNSITKYFTFNINGLTIGQIDNPYKVTIDNDHYSMTVNDVEVLWFDGNGRGYIPELTITKLLNLFGYAIDQDEHGRVNCEYVGG